MSGALSGHHRRREDGAVAVEFAILVPLLLLIVFGIINFAIIFSQQLALNNGIRQGVRLAVAAGNTANQTCSQVVTASQAASGPAIAMNTGQIAIQVQRVSSANVNTVGLDCFSGAYVKTPTGANVNTRVCASNSGDNSIRAQARYTTGFITPIPFFSSPTLTLKATAVYRCEFSS